MIPIVAAVLGLILIAIFPTATYLYVEKRARAHWVDVAEKRAPGPVRLTAWVSLALGQLCLVWLVLPVVCGGLVYALSRVGHGGTLGYGLILGLGLAALLQSLTSFGLIPFGVRVLARNSKTRERAKGLGRGIGLVNASALLLAGVTYGSMHVPGMLHPIIKIGLTYGVALPVGIYAIFGLVLAALMTRAASAK
jgi:hypothetical protein